MKYVLAARLPLPFYLRLPHDLVPAADPEGGRCAFLNYRRLGNVSFENGWAPPGQFAFSPDAVIDSFAQPDQEIETRGMCMTCDTASGLPVPTLTIKTGPEGGFSEMRPYSEGVLFFVTDGRISDVKSFNGRLFSALNHILDVYRAVTQDPYVFRLDPELDVFVVNYLDAQVPQNLQTAPNDEILAHLPELSFSGSRFHYRLNTLEDLFPGHILEPAFLAPIGTLAVDPTYTLPLHYELVFRAQHELKRRHYHMAILEAEAAFEAYIAHTVIIVAVSNAEARTSLIADMDDPRKLQLLGKRLQKLDMEIGRHRATIGLPPLPGFVGSSEHSDWKAKLYSPRHEVVHEGRRSITFDEARDAIAAGKRAVKAIEDRIPSLAERVQIYPGVDHLKNTAGRLRW